MKTEFADFGSHKNSEGGEPMESSKSLVVYYSRSGHTRSLAKRVAHALGADIEEIKTSAPYEPGAVGYFRALLHSALGRTPAIQSSAKNVNDYDLVVVASPVWGSAPAAPVRSFLKAHQGEFRKVAFVASQGGTAGRVRLFRLMQEACALEPRATLAVGEKELGTQNFRLDFASFVERLRWSAGGDRKLRVS